MPGPLVGDADDERDRQATVTDFLDYTEHLPTDVERSLKLLRKQDELAQQSVEELHRLLAQYSKLPPTNDPYESALLRARISYLFELTQRRRESSAAEAARLHNEVQRQHKRLISVKAKLQALPEPPSRDPTPQPQGPKSPQAKRGDGIRINLKVGGQKVQGALPRRPRYRKVTVPGEVLSPPNPGSPTLSELNEWDDEEMDEEPLAAPVAVLKKEKDRDRDRKRDRNKEKKKDRSSNDPRPKKDRPPKLPGQMGTNVHSAIAGISTSNALSLLTPPPESAVPGTRFAPWFRLTEYEMARLRKRMKKNAIWAPSDTMIRRELVDSGRGHEAYQRARRLAEEAGETLIDDDDVQGQIAGNRPLKPGEISADVKAKTTNKGMSLNVQKKEKKQMMLQQQAALYAQQTADLAAQRLGSLGESFRTLFDRPSAPTTPTESGSKGQKRKRESGATPSALDLQLQAQLSPDIMASPAKQSSKRQRNGGTTPKTTTNTTTTTIPTAPPAPSPIKIEPASKTESGTGPSPKESRRTNSTIRRPSLILKPPAPESALAEPPSATLPTRQSSRPTSRRASAGPLDSAMTRQSPRLKSATPAPTPTTATAPTAASRRSKRPAPGPVTANQEGGAAVTVGKRKSAPKKKGKLNVEEGKKSEEYAAEEDIDPDEPRYCVCDGVSYGTMVCCENPNVSFLWQTVDAPSGDNRLTILQCEREWFHLECVGLTEPPARRAKWWCPNCDPSKQKGKR